MSCCILYLYLYYCTCIYCICNVVHIETNKIQKSKVCYMKKETELDDRPHSPKKEEKKAIF